MSGSIFFSFSILIMWYGFRCLCKGSGIMRTHQKWGHFSDFLFKYAGLWIYKQVIKKEGLVRQDPLFCGCWWIRTTEVERQQIYSLPHLATLENTLFVDVGGFEPSTLCLSDRYSKPAELNVHGVSKADAKLSIFFVMPNFLRVFLSPSKTDRNIIRRDNL